MTEKLPSVVIVGRPNVGKSTIFNRLTGTRRSIVTDEPGITRDRIYGTATWQERSFEVVDTGGIVPDDKAAIPREILRQAQVAIEGASQLLLVVDVRAGLTPLDSELARLLRRTGKPLAILANKVDTQMQESLAAPFYALSNDVFPVSAEHGYGFDTLLEAITARLGAAGPEQEETPVPEKQDQQVNVAIIGRPNVGKSTMLNRLSGVDRAIVSDIPGTTRDAVDTVVRHGERTYRFVDTAGIRRKGKTNLVAEKMSVMMARRHLEQADVALLIVDASLGVTANDANIAGYAEESGRSVIIVMNKWDLALEAAAEKAARELEHQETKPHVVESSYRQAARKARGGKHTSVVRKKAVTGRVDPAQLVEDYEKIVRTRFKFLDYAPIVFRLREDRRAHRKIIRPDRPRGRRAAQAHLDRRTESLGRGSRSGPRHFARRAPREDLLRHAGRRFAADIYFVHQSIQAPAFQLRAVSRKSASQEFRFYRHAHSIPPAPEGKARAGNAPVQPDEDGDVGR